MSDPTIVALNEAIMLRGISGSARAAEQVRAAILESGDLQYMGVRPSHHRSSFRAANLLRDCHWDLRGAAHAARRAPLLISPCNIGRAGPQQRHLLFVYDVMLWESPKLFDPAFVEYARRAIVLSLRRADLVLTLSLHAAEVLGSLAPRASIQVQPLACSLSVQPPSTREFPTGRPVVLVVGETAPHKNHITTIESVRRVRDRTEIDLRLRLIGPRGRAERDVLAAVANADPDGTWISRECDVSQATLAMAYSSAWVLVQASLNEGFGLPLIEAAQRGLPVVHSGVAGMAEILPRCSVDATEAAAICARLESLLEGANWQATSQYVYDEAKQYEWPHIRAALLARIRGLIHD